MKKNILLAIAIVMIIVVNSCKKEKVAKGTDKDLFSMSNNSTGFIWYKKSSALLGKSSGSGHPQPLLKTRYNAIAGQQLDSVGKIKSGAVFSEGSLIVKELYSDASTIDRYAILYKQSSNPEADAKGWVWGYLNANGTVSQPSSDKGKACTGCHSQTDNIDYMLMNKFFP